MSSSTSGQWMPTPAPMRRQLRRWAAEARCSRGNQARGTLTSRPSARVARRALSVTVTSMTSGLISMAEVLIPGLLKLRLMLLHKPQERRQFMAAEPGGTGQTHRVKPELGIAFSVLHVNVGWLLALPAEKEEAKAICSQHRWHTKNIR